jgi:UDP-N-acetylmuramoyl-tripeptide--D-alanyl-D-alanine ligase
MNIKKLGKHFLCKLLEGQAKQLIAKNNIVIIAVGGSVGKTSTKLAIAKTLEKWTSVIYQEGNYNDRLTVPLVLFNQAEPSIFNLFAWARILLSNNRALKNPYEYKYAVLEIGTDGPGQLADFAYLKPDLYVLTSIAEEHMEYFGSIGKVASEELTPVQFSKQTLINTDTAKAEYLSGLSFLSYGSSKDADYQVVKRDQQLDIKLKDEKKPLIVKTKLLGEQGAMVLLAAASVNHILGKTGEAVKQALEQVEPVAGRMQQLKGANDSLIIDDTYNASPIAVKAALDVLYSMKAKKRIALLGSMNELGTISTKEHQKVGAYCDPKKLDLVVTIGSIAKAHLAPAAKKAGCQVVSYLSPVDAGIYVRDLVEEGTVILAKGSQNGVFSEEAVKKLLSDPSDSHKLVRQSKYWLNAKSKQFKL